MKCSPFSEALKKIKLCFASRDRRLTAFFSKLPLCPLFPYAVLHYISPGMAKEKDDLLKRPARLQAPSVPKRRWGLALLLGFGVLVNYFDRVNLSVSRDALQASFGISAVMFGYLSSAYNWTYAMLQLPSGLLLDRFGVRRVGLISTVIWSAASFAAAVSAGVGSLFGARFLLGIGEAPTFPANAKATGYWFPKEERSLATAVFDSAAKFASAIGIPALGLLLVYFGWRWSFAATGFISLLYFALFYAFYRNPSEDKLLTVAEREFIARGGAQPEDRARAAKGAPLVYLIRQRRVW